MIFIALRNQKPVIFEAFSLFQAFIKMSEYLRLMGYLLCVKPQISTPNCQD